MSLRHGEHIEADVLELEVSRWPNGERFARLCNAVIWALSWPCGSGLPAFTERITVRDNGIDAEWQRELAVDEAPSHDVFLRVGLNVAQYKKRASHPATRNAAISELTSKLRGEFRRVERRTGKKLSSYLLWTNLHLTTEQAVELRTAILECYPETVEAERPHVGAAQLASMLVAGLCRRRAKTRSGNRLRPPP